MFPQAGRNSSLEATLHPLGKKRLEALPASIPWIHTQSGILVKPYYRSDLGVFMYNLLEGLCLVMSFRLVIAPKPRPDDEVNVQSGIL